MSATEIAAVVEGWATLVGLIVVIAGAGFAGVQLRQQARAQAFQTTMAVISEVLSREVGLAWRNHVQPIPDGTIWPDLTAEQKDAAILVAGSYARLGTLMAAGFVKEDDVFHFPNITNQAIVSWEKVKHAPRANESELGIVPGLIFHEYVAARAQRYLERKGVEVYGKVPRFDANPETYTRVAHEISRARSAA